MQDLEDQKPSEKDIVQTENMSNAPNEKCLENGGFEFEKYEIIEDDRHVCSRSIAQELKIDHKTVSSHLSKVEFKKKLGLGATNTKKHDESYFHLQSPGQTE
ncbi:hypothetical protein TNCV_2815721 [Trichonephila clavipes]|nr:hypothetical protein TNCV_2815721 [Trichonephila clavipes]